MAAIDDAAVTIALVEGSTSSVIAAKDFPKAKTLPLPELTSLADIFVSLADGKADIVLSTPESAQQYNANNPDKIARVSARAPLRLFGTSLAIAGGQDRLRRMLDIATDAMLYSGQIEKIVAPYDKIPGAMLRPAAPYQDSGVQ